MASNSLQRSQGSPLATKFRLQNWPVSVLGITLLGLYGFLGIRGQSSMAAAQSEHDLPYTAYVIDPEASVRSGPGLRHYPTATLPVGFAVQVYRHDLEDLGQKSENPPHPGGTWCAIRPPQGSLSWVESRQIRKRADGAAEILGDRTAVRIGSRLSARHSAVQVLLTRGELVKLATSGASADRRWLAIEPPAGEFRWILASQLSRQPPQAAQPLTGDSPSPAPLRQSPWKSQHEARAVRQARQEKKQAGAGASQAVPSTPIQPPVVATSTQTFTLSPDEPIRVVAGSPAALQLAQLQQLPLSSPSPAPPPTALSSDPPTALSDSPTVEPHGSNQTASPRIHFHNLTTNLPDPPVPAPNQQATDQHATGQLPQTQQAAGPPVSSSLALNQAKRLGELQVRLSRMVVQDPGQWQFEQIRREADSLITQAETAALRDKTRDFLDQITVFERVRSRRLEPDMILAGNNQPQTTLTGLGEAATGATANMHSSHPQRQLDMRQRVQSDLTTGPDRRTRRLGSDRGANHLAALEEAPDTVRYDAVGLLKPVVSRRDHSPRYALVDDHGKVISFITPTSDVNLKPYLGRRIGVNGTRGFMPEFRRAHVTASRITPIRR